MISNLIEQVRRIIISGAIKEELAAQFLEQITAFECVSIDKPITIYIDTYGGDVDAALSMYDAIKSCYCPIVTVGIGKVMSAGVLILAAGDHGNRFVTQNTRVMIHEISSGVVGTLDEMESSVVEVRKLQDIFVDLMVKETGVSKAKIKNDILKDYYMSAQESIKYGIADKIVPTRKTVKVSSKGDVRKSGR